MLKAVTKFTQSSALHKQKIWVQSCGQVVLVV